MAYDGSIEADPDPVPNGNPGPPPSSPPLGSQQVGDPSNSFLDSLKDIFASLDEDFADDANPPKGDPSGLPPSGSLSGPTPSGFPSRPPTSCSPSSPPSSGSLPFGCPSHSPVSGASTDNPWSTLSPWSTNTAWPTVRPHGAAYIGGK